MQPAREQLKDWIDRRQYNQREAANYLGFDESHLSSLLGGRRQPGLSNAIKLERLTGIPVEAWMSSELDESKQHQQVSPDNANTDKG